MFRGQLRQLTRLISSLGFVFLPFIGISFFAKLGGQVSPALAFGVSSAASQR